METKNIDLADDTPPQEGLPLGCAKFNVLTCFRTEMRSKSSFHTLNSNDKMLLGFKGRGLCGSPKGPNNDGCKATGIQQEFRACSS